MPLVWVKESPWACQTVCRGRFFISKTRVLGQVGLQIEAIIIFVIIVVNIELDDNFTAFSLKHQFCCRNHLKRIKTISQQVWTLIGIVTMGSNEEPDPEEPY